MFINFDVWYFSISCLVMTNWSETPWSASQLPPLSCYCADLSWLAQLCLVLSEVECLHASWNEIILVSFNAVHVSKNYLYSLKINIHAFCAFWGCFVFVITGISWALELNWWLYWKWILMFTMVLSIPINCEHTNTLYKLPVCVVVEKNVYKVFIHAWSNQ